MRNLDGMWRVLPLDGARFKDIRDNEGVCAELFRIFQPSFDEEKRQILSAKAGDVHMPSDDWRGEWDGAELA